MDTEKSGSAEHIKRGLEGVVVDTSSVSKVMPEINSLVYRGYPVQDLAENCSFEEVAYLLWHDDLPNRAQMQSFQKQERMHRHISNDLLQVIRLYPHYSHPMDTLRTSVSFLGLEEPRIWENDHPTNLDKAIHLLSKIPTMIAADYRFKKGQEFIHPKADLGFSENFFHMCFGKVPAPEVVKAFDVSMILYAEHGFNASTFTTRVVTSTMSDMFSAVVAGIGALKGPLHGGANEQVMHMLKEIGEVQNARAWMLDALDKKRKIMGFGHRVYKNGDSRVPTMKKYAQNMAKFTGQGKWLEISEILEKTMLEKKDIRPNLDFPAGPAYYMMGFDIDMFTPLFVMARITGWCAHIMEQAENNRLIRPLSEYTGHKERKVTALMGRT